MKNLLQHIQDIDVVRNCGNEKQLYLLSVVPKAIANKADVKNEFCGGKDDDGFRRLVCNPR